MRRAKLSACEVGDYVAIAPGSADDTPSYLRASGANEFTLNGDRRFTRDRSFEPNGETIDVWKRVE